MPKKYEISIQAQVLLKLLRIALGTEPTAKDGKLSELFPENTDWREVICLSYEQKVSALAVDGLKASGYDPREGKNGLQLEELNAVLKPWFEDVKSNEESYAYYLTVLSTLCQIFSANGLKPVILKGYGLSRDYPIPSHRGAGDIDIFLIDKDGNPAADKGDQIARDILKLEVTRIGKEHHSSFTFKGILVENHHELRGKFLKTEAENIFLEQLKQLATKDIEVMRDIPGAFAPSVTFNAIFLMRHMIGNLHHGLLNLRQIVDWCYFLKANGEKVDWTLVNAIQEEAGLSKFSADLNGFISTLCNFDIPKGVSATTDDNTIKNIMQELLNPVKQGGNIVKRLTYYYRNRWTTRYFFNKHWLVPLFTSIVKHLPFRLKNQ